MRCESLGTVPVATWTLFLAGGEVGSIRSHPGASGFGAIKIRFWLRWGLGIGLGIGLGLGLEFGLGSGRGLGLRSGLVPVAGHALRERVHRGEHGQRGEAVGVPVEGGEQVAPTEDVRGGDDQQVAVGHRRRLVEVRHDLGRVLADRGHVEVLPAQEDERVLVALAWLG